MIVQSSAAVLRFPSALAGAAAYASAPRQTTAAAAAATADRVSISDAARQALAAAGQDGNAVEARLAEIRARGPVNRSEEDQAFLLANDQRLAEIAAKPYDARSADEIDYLQQAVGFVNTFAYLSPAEKALYDQAVASGNSEAAEGISQVALIRAGGEMAGGAGGTTYNPRHTALTAANVEQYFIHSIVDETGQAQSRFHALARFLQSNQQLS